MHGASFEIENLKNFVGGKCKCERVTGKNADDYFSQRKRYAVPRKHADNRMENSKPVLI
jgi:hypothetical protein